MFMNADNSSLEEHSSTKEMETFYPTFFYLFFNQFKMMCLLTPLKSDTVQFLHLLGHLTQNEESFMSINAPSTFNKMKLTKFQLHLSAQGSQALSVNISAMAQFQVYQTDRYRIMDKLS